MDNTVNLSNINGGSFPLIDRQHPLTDNMKTYLTKNVPFFNPINSNVNIVFSFKGNLFYIYKKSEINASVDNSYLFDFCNGTYTKYNDPLPSDLPSVNIYNHLAKQLIYTYNQEKIVIPLYYLAIDHTDVFEIYINQLNLKSEDDIIRVNYVDNSFFMLNSRFNIFNLSIFTYTFDKVLKLFVDLFNNVKIDIVSELKKIYLPLMPTVIKLYGLFKYKSEYLKTSKAVFLDETKNPDNIVANVKKNQICDDNNINDIINTLRQQIINLTEKLNRISVEVQTPQYKYMFLMSILRYRIIYPQLTNSWQSNMQLNMDILQSISETNIDAKNETINKAFLMSKYPTLYENLTATYKNVSYGDCMENVCLQFLKLVFYNIDIQKYIIPSEVTNIQLIELFKRVSKEERTNVQFRNDWAKFVTELSTGYDFINTTLNIELNPKFKNFYIFCSKIFIFKNPDNTLSLLDDYDEKNHDKNIERLNEVLTKKYRITITVKSTTNSDTININLTDAFETKYTIELYHKIHARFLELNDNKTELIQNISEIKDSTINSSTDVLNILNNNNNNVWTHKYIKKFVLIKLMFINDDISRMVIKKYSNNFIENVFTYEIDIAKTKKYNIFVIILFNNNKLHKVTPLFWFIVLKNYHYIIYESEQFFRNISEEDEILNTWTLKNSEEDSIWHYAVRYIKDDVFWMKISEKLEILKIWSLLINDLNYTVWHYAVQYINIYDFWIKIANILNTDTFLIKKADILNTDTFMIKKADILNIESDMIHTWMLINNIDNTVWHYATENIKSGRFWITFVNNIDLNILNEMWLATNKQNNTVWNSAISSINSEAFWMKIIENNNILNKWLTVEGKYNYTIWNTVIGYIKFDAFWMKIVEKNDILYKLLDSKNSSNNNFWYNATEHIKTEQFWITLVNKIDLNILNEMWSAIYIYDNTLYTYRPSSIDKYNTVWHNATIHIKSNVFWMKIAEEKNILNNWSDLKDKFNNTIWHSATRYIKSEAFWIQISEKNDILNKWSDLKNNDGNTLWHNVTEYINLEAFWMKIVEKKDILNKWSDLKDKSNNTVWHIATKNIKSEAFWMKISENNDILNKWLDLKNDDGNTVWHIATQYIKSNVFWIKISEDKDILNKLSESKNDNQDTIWHIATIYIKSDVFWMKIVEDDKDILYKWSELKNNFNNTVWHIATINIKLEAFWMKIADMPDILNKWLDLKNDGNDTVWHFAIIYIKSVAFWMKIVDMSDILKTWSIQNQYNRPNLSIATKYIKSNVFWMKILDNEEVLQVWKISREELAQKLMKDGIILTGGMINSNTLYFNGLVSF